ncbi:Peptidase M17 N domain containing protein [Asbolus verrucosus]|uniref:Peptidase M17 N domain containing protein n=1 Tax=Asbolus verrucosus TaxID=1661398 RepID=A0A482W5C1_ASBVE|nr:Peptidase M17 N domain containing protein [Asbolus verrucosus]
MQKVTQVICQQQVLFQAMCHFLLRKVLGVYGDDECEGLELTPAAEKFNQISQGKLSDQLKL